MKPTPFLLLLATVLLQSASAQLVISGNENKIDLTSGAPVVIQGAEPDSLTLLDFSVTPPKVTHLMDVPNTVIGPPSNIAITPDGKLALIANSVKIDPADETQFIPESRIHVLDLTANPPRIVGRVEAGAQPSGISITPDGRIALVANRADGSISVLKIDGSRVEPLGQINVAAPADSVSDVAIAQNGRLVLASVQKGGYLAVLELDGQKLRLTGQKISVYGQPYRVVITPDGSFALTAGAGFGNGLDQDAATIVDLTKDPITAVDYVTVGAIPESIEVSPDGRLAAVVVMNGSNLARNHPQWNPNGGVTLLERSEGTFKRVQTELTGRIPEGVAFTSDGKKLIVQCHPDRELWVYDIRDNRIASAPTKIPLPGMPSSLRAAP